jgi:hypothetical protein
MMNANDVIESYVTDVALQLPRKQRNDVAFELRALIDEGLQDKAEAAGRDADAAMAIEFVRAFGRPEEVAARYRPTLTIIDPVDGRSFLRASVIGLLVIWCLGLLQHFQRPIGSGWDFLQALGQWWGTTLIPSLWWPGLLAVGFGATAWVRRRWPESSVWKPRADDRIVGGRAAMVMGLVGILCGLSLLIEPRWLLDVFWGGRAAPAAYRALTYTDAFWHRQGPCLLALIALNIPVVITMIVRGRRSVLLRRIETTLGLATCAVMVWTVLDGPVFMARSSDAMMKLSMGLITVFTLIGIGVNWHRSVRPRPSQQIQSS